MSDFMRWMTHGIKRGRFEMSPRAARYVSVLIVVLTLVSALYLMLVSRTAARGRHIEQLRVELSRLRRENEQLEVEVARDSATFRLLERAAGMRLGPAEQVEYLRPPAEGQ